jgi:diguanylate cyclase (GGDEF)-like protein
MQFPTGPGDDELRRLLSLTERGMAAVQEMIAVLRENDRDMVALVQRVRQLELLVWSDVLTGLLNRRGLEEEMSREEARSRRYGTPVAVALLDIEGLKQVNERHGFTGGDAMLRAVGTALRSGARDSDIVARIGDDQFVAVLPGAELTGAQVYVDRVRGAARYAHLPNGSIVPIQLTAGVATREEAGALPDALELAGRRLLTEKRRADGSV